MTGYVADIENFSKLTCTGKQTPRVYTHYSPPHHLGQLLQSTRAEVDASIVEYDGISTDSAIALASAVVIPAEMTG